MLRRMHRDERGVAMVIAVTVSFVVLLLSLYIVQLSIHNSTQSAYDRKRVTSIAAAESGIDRMWSVLEVSTPETLPCSSALTGTLGSSPGTATYSVSVTYYNSTGTALTCPMSQSNVPSAVLVTSVGRNCVADPDNATFCDDGTSGTYSASLGTGAKRTMQSYLTLSPTWGGIGSAILVNSAASFSNSFTLNGYTGTDADIYVNNGDLTITNSPNVYGNIYVPNGSYSQSNNSIIRGSVWANGSVAVQNPAVIVKDATSSTTSLTGTGSINGSARAGTTIASTLTVGGSKYENSPQGAPPSQAFPYVCWTAVAGVCSAQSSNWTAAGYTVNNYSDCTSARTFLTGGTISGNVVVRINAVCNLSIALNDVITFTGNLAIITDGGITMANQNTWNGSTGKNLFLLVNYRSGLNCSSGSYNISTGNNSNFVNANVSFYTPCAVIMNNQNSFSGQIIGQSVTITNNFTMNFVPVLIPGAAERIIGFRQSIVYLREVTN